MMPVALMAWRTCQHCFGGDGRRATWDGVAVEDLPAPFVQSAAQTFGDERLRMLAEPGGGGFAFQQFRDGWKRPQ